MFDPSFKTNWVVLEMMGIPGSWLALSLCFIEKSIFKEPTAQGHDALWIIESLETFR